MYVGKTKALISLAVTAKLICVFVFAYAKRLFSHDAAHLFLICLMALIRAVCCWTEAKKSNRRIRREFCLVFSERRQHP